MKKTILVNVTKRRIELGLKDNCNYCPIALAVRAHTGYKYAIVKRDRAILIDRKGMTKARASLPISAREFIACFDRGRRVNVLKFRLTFNKA